MASLTYTPATHRAVIQAERPNDPTRRFTVSVPKVSRKVAESIKLHIEHLVNSKASGEPIPPQTALWLREVGAKLHGRLAAAGLVSPREVVAAIGLKAMCDSYIARRTDLKSRTLINLKQTLRELVDFFGVNRDTRTINKAEAKDWRRKMAERLAEPTVATHVKKAREIFADAVERKMLPENPFTKLEAGSFVNNARNVYVPVADIEAVIQQCPDDEWRLIFGLARFAGLRCPSEILKLRWADVDWETDALNVRAPKTERYKGKDRRTVPIVPRLRALLLALFTKAEDGATHIIATHRNANHRTMAEKLIERAKLKRWPRLFQNLRASCETDLTSVLPIHAACQIIGNSEAVAKRHYLTVTEEHMDQAKKALYGALQTVADYSGQSAPETAKTPVLAEVSHETIPPRGSEPYADFPRILQDSHNALQAALHDYVQTEYRRSSRLRRASRKLMVQSRRTRNGGAR